MSMQQDVATTWRWVADGGGWRAWAGLLGLVLMVGAMIGVMWLQVQPVVDRSVWLFGAVSVAGLALWKTMLASRSPR